MFYNWYEFCANLQLPTIISRQTRQFSDCFISITVREAHRERCGTRESPRYRVLDNARRSHPLRSHAFAQICELFARLTVFEMKIANRLARRCLEDWEDRGGSRQSRQTIARVSIRLLSVRIDPAINRDRSHAALSL